VKAVKGKNIGIHQGKQLGLHDELNVAKIFLISSLILDFSYVSVQFTDSF